MVANTPIAGFDHPVIAVRDMDASRARFERMGFTVPPRGSHKEWGTGNWCIMFPQDYLELRGIVDAKRYTHQLDTFLALREGLMGVAFAPRGEVTDAAEALRKRGLHPEPPRELTRAFELPDGPIDVRFRLLFFNRQETGAMMASLICQHLTPERIRRPDYLVHANTAHAVSSMTGVVADLDEAERLTRPYFDAGAVQRMQDRVVVDVGRGAKLHLVSARVAASEDVALDGVAPPYLSAVAISVGSIAACEAALRAGDTRHVRRSERVLRVAAPDGCGTVLDFVESPGD